jgi:hypothetical protein
MAIVPFEDGPIHGILFFIPPLTFYYLARHWKKLKRSALRLIEPAATILLVVLAFIFVPSLSGSRSASTAASDRLLGPGGKLERKVQEERDKAKALNESSGRP